MNVPKDILDVRDQLLADENLATLYRTAEEKLFPVLMAAAEARGISKEEKAIVILRSAPDSIYKAVVLIDIATNPDRYADTEEELQTLFDAAAAYIYPLAKKQMEEIQSKLQPEQ